MSAASSHNGRAIGVQMHGVTLNLHGDHPDLVEHTACLLEGLTTGPWPDPDLEVNAHWRVGEHDPERPYFDAGGLDGFGKRMLLAEDRLVWPDTHRDRDLQLRFGRRGRAFVFDVACCYNPSSKKLAKYPDYERKKFFDLLRYLVHFPIAWRLERTRGWSLLHASAVADGDRAVLIAGPGGCGKTTTAVALAARAGLSLVSENLLFYDGDAAHPLCEPIRLTDESVALLGPDAGGLEPLRGAARLKYKSMYRLPVAAAGAAVRPEAIFVPRFSHRGFLRHIEPGAAAELLGAVNRLTLELCDYDWYRAALDLLWPEPGHSRRLVGALEQLARTVPCWALGIDRAAGVGPVVDRVLECWPGSAPAGRNR